MKYRILLFIVFAFCVGNIIADSSVRTITREFSRSEIGDDTVTVVVNASEIGRETFPAMFDTDYCKSTRRDGNKEAVFTIIGYDDSISVYESVNDHERPKGGGAFYKKKGDLVLTILLKEKINNGYDSSENSSPEDGIASTNVEKEETPVPEEPETDPVEDEEQGKELQNYVLWGIIVVVVLLLILLCLNLILKKLLIEQKKVVDLISENLEKNSEYNQERSNGNLVKQSGIDGKIDSLLKQFALLQGTIENLQQSVTRVSATATVNRPIQGGNNIQKASVTTNETSVESVKYCGYNAGIHGFKSKDFFSDSNLGQFVIYLGNGKYEYGINSILADQLWSVLDLVEKAVELSGDKFNVNGKTFKTVQRGVLVKGANGDFTIIEKAKVEIVTK